MARIKAVQEQIANSATLYYTVPASKKFTVTAAQVINTSATASVTLTLYFVKSGGATSDADAKVIDALAVSNTDKSGIGLPTVIAATLETGDMIYAEAGAATSLTLRISGIEE